MSFTNNMVMLIIFSFQENLLLVIIVYKGLIKMNDQTNDISKY